MIPPGAIPPLTDEGLQTLVGMKCMAPHLRALLKYWRVEIRGIRYVTEHDAIVRVHGGHSFGKPRDVALSLIRWGGKQVTEPLILQMHRTKFYESLRKAKQV